MRSFVLPVAFAAIDAVIIGLTSAVPKNKTISVTGFADSCVSASLDGWILKAYCQDDVGNWNFDASLNLGLCFAYGAGGVLICNPDS